jgi:hypothetical protein
LDWSAFSAIASIVSILCTIGGVAYLAGKFSQRIENGEGRLDDHHERLNTHDERLGKHEVDIGRLKEWKEGFHLGAKMVQDKGQ